MVQLTDVDQPTVGKEFIGTAIGVLMPQHTRVEYDVSAHLCELSSPGKAPFFAWVTEWFSVGRPWSHTYFTGVRFPGPGRQTILFLEDQVEFEVRGYREIQPPRAGVRCFFSRSKGRNEE